MGRREEGSLMKGPERRVSRDEQQLPHAWDGKELGVFQH